MKRQQGEKAFAARAAAAGLSKSQLAEAKKAGVDIDDPAAVAAYRATINTRSDSRNSPPNPVTGEAELMTVENIERALSSKGLTPNDARVLKIQLEGLRAAIALKQQRNQVISRAEIDERDAKIAHALNAMFRRLENELPPGVLGMTIAQSKPFVKDRVRELQRTLADGLSEFWQTHPES